MLHHPRSSQILPFCQGQCALCTGAWRRAGRLPRRTPLSVCSEVVVGDHFADAHVMAGEVGGGARQEAGAAGAGLVRQDLRIRGPGVVIDRGVHVVEAEPAPGGWPCSAAVGLPAAAVRDPADLLHVDMYPFSSAGTFAPLGGAAAGLDHLADERIAVRQPGVRRPTAVRVRRPRVDLAVSGVLPMRWLRRIGRRVADSHAGRRRADWTMRVALGYGWRRRLDGCRSRRVRRARRSRRAKACRCRASRTRSLTAWRDPEKWSRPSGSCSSAAAKGSIDRWRLIAE